MPGKILGENVTFQIEVEENPQSILLVFDRKCEIALVPWENAHNLANAMAEAVIYAKPLFKPATSWELVKRETEQIKLNHHKGLVAIVVDWTDRIRFSTLEAFAIVADAIRKSAQDAHLEQRGIHLLYDKKGMLRKLYNRNGNYTQHIR